MFSSLKDAWDRCSPSDLVWIATRPGVLTDRELRLFAVYCARSVQHLMTDPRSIAAIEVAERYANGDATVQEMEAAAKAADDVGAYSSGAVRTAAYVAYFAANTEYAARFSYAYVAAAAYDSAIRATAKAANAARAAQAEWLRQNTKPNFN